MIGVAKAETLTITTFTIPGALSTDPEGINDAGEVVGSYIDSQGDRLGFLREANGNIITINNPSGLSTQASGINNAGVIVGNIGTGGPSGEAFIRDVSGQFTNIVYPLVPPIPGTSNVTAFRTINNNGQILMEWAVGGNSGGTQWTNGGWAIRNADGSYTSMDSSLTTWDNFRWYGLNDAGAAVGEYFDSQAGFTQGVIREPDGTFVTVPSISPGQSTNLTGINNSGWIVGDEPYGFVEDPSAGITTLPTGYLPTDINNDEVIVGTAGSVGFIATMPEPSSFALALIGSIVMVAVRLRRRSSSSAMPSHAAKDAALSLRS